MTRHKLIRERRINPPFNARFIPVPPKLTWTAKFWNRFDKLPVPVQEWIAFLVCCIPGILLACYLKLTNG